MKATNQIQKMFKDEQGAVAIITAVVTFFVLVGVAALAIDIGKSATTKNELQNAVDTAALAAARELGVQLGVQDDEEEFGITDVKDAAINAAFENKANNNPVVLVYDDITLGRWDEPNFSPNAQPYNAVLVKREGYEFNNFFARIFNINTSRVSAEAIAIVGTAKGPAGGEGEPKLKNLIPFALTETVAAELQEKLKADEDTDKDIYFKFSPGDMLEFAAGNWGTVNFEGPGAASQKLAQWTKEGYDGTVAAGDYIWTAPSAHVNSAPMLEALDHRIWEANNNDDVRLIVPVISFPNDAALGSDVIKIEYFAAVTIVSREGQGAFLTVQINFHGDLVSTGPIIPGEPGDSDGSGDLEVKSIALVK